MEDLDGAIARYKDLGYGVVQSGAWGDIGKPGSGRYGYMGTDSIGGVTAELLADRAFRIVPITDEDAHELVRSLRGSPARPARRKASRRLR